MKYFFFLILILVTSVVNAETSTKFLVECNDVRQQGIELRLVKQNSVSLISGIIYLDFGHRRYRFDSLVDAIVETQGGMLHKLKWGSIRTDSYLELIVTGELIRETPQRLPFLFKSILSFKAGAMDQFENLEVNCREYSI